MLALGVAVVVEGEVAVVGKAVGLDMVLVLVTVKLVDMGLMVGCMLREAVKVEVVVEEGQYKVPV